MIFCVEKWPFFRADMAGLGKCCTGGYGRIGVYRVIDNIHKYICDPVGSPASIPAATFDRPISSRAQ